MDTQISAKIRQMIKDVGSLQVDCNAKQWNLDFEYILIGLEGHLTTVEKYEMLEAENDINTKET